MSPECKFFSDIKEEWESHNITSQTEFITLSKDLQGRQAALDFYEELLMRRNRRNELTIRDDYRELAECAVLVLGELPPSGKIIWRKPGACHKARFCAFGIYSLKALAFAKQFDWDDDTIAGLRQFCAFTAIIYIPYFLSSSIGCDATVNDLDLYKKLYAYKSTDAQLAEESLVVLRRHGWYSTPEVSVFSLFSEKVSVDEKSRLACKLLSLTTSVPESYKLVKPKFQKIDEKTSLSDLITPQSFKFFSILNEIGAALAFIGEKSRGICFSSWDFQNFQIPGEFLSISPHLVGFIKICPDPTPSTRSSLHLAGFTD